MQMNEALMYMPVSEFREIEISKRCSTISKKERRRRTKKKRQNRRSKK